MRTLLLILLLLSSTLSFGQQGPNILEARRSGVQFIKQPPVGVLRVEVSEEYHNIVLVYLCGFRGSVPLACLDDYNVTMTTVKGRKVTLTDFRDASFGTIKPDEFPLMIDAKVKGLKGDEKYPFEFSVKLMYKGFCYRIYVYDEWTEVKGGIH